MTDAEKKLVEEWCENHDLTYFIDGKGKHCLCDVSWIARFDTEEEMIKYIKEH